MDFSCKVKAKSKSDGVRVCACVKGQEGRTKWASECEKWGGLGEKLTSFDRNKACFFRRVGGSKRRGGESVLSSVDARANERVEMSCASEKASELRSAFDSV